MKYLLFYHSHRHLDELYYSSLFFNRSDFLKNNFEVYVSSNNKNFSISQLENVCKFETKTYISITNKNAGYSLGQVAAESDLFEMFRDYEKVLFCQPDCYIVDDTKLKESFLENFDALVSPIYHIGRICYTGDFFVLKPDKNIFKGWQKLYDPNNDRNIVHEHYLTDCINSTYTNIKTIERKGHQERHIDNYGLWHEHDNSKVRNVLKI
jgi:hypothetical protein